MYLPGVRGGGLGDGCGSKVRFIDCRKEACEYALGARVEGESGVGAG